MADNADRRYCGIAEIPLEIPRGPYREMGRALHEAALKRGFDLWSEITETRNCKGAAGPPWAHLEEVGTKTVRYTVFKRLGRGES